MATTRKPAAKAATKPTPTRKKTTKRGPTKAAALKALGLTQEDLDTLKLVAQARATVGQTQDSQPEIEPAPGPEVTYDQPKSEKEPSTEASAPPGGYYMRNLRGPEISFRLTRQQKRGDKRTELKPRGQRGDLKKLEPEDLQDPELISQIEYGLIEIITAAEAAEIIRKQATNQQTTTHPAMAVLRNELGQEYGHTDAQGKFHKQERVQVVGDNSITVARLTPQGGEAGALPDAGRRGIDWQAARNLGGNPAIISDGFAPQQGPLSEAQRDAIARRRDIEGPAAGLGGLQVTVAPTERT